MLQYRKILAPVDFAEISNSALRQAADHSEQSQSELLIAHIVDNELPEYASAANVSVESEQSLTCEAEIHIDELLDVLEIGYCEKLVRTGHTVTELLKIIVEKEIDLVVMGTHNRIPASERYKSVTMAIVENAECDVLVLHK